MWAGMGEQPKHGIKEIDITTGKVKETKPLKDALNYGRWDSIAVRSPEYLCLPCTIQTRSVRIDEAANTCVV